jgi:RNA polymerase sigma factor (sigma-70 family)
VLVQQCIKGERAAYRQLYDRYAKSMYNTALRIVNQSADAEDILQEAFSDAFAKLTEFEGRSTFGAWLKQIVVHKSVSLLKKQRLMFTNIECEMAANATEEEQVNEHQILYTIESIKLAIRQLPDGYRTVLSLYLFEGYDHEEIAEILQLAKSTVRSQYIRGKEKLLQRLKKEELYEQ